MLSRWLLLFFVFEASFTSVASSQTLQQPTAEQHISKADIVHAMDITGDGFISPVDIAVILDVPWPRATKLFRLFSKGGPNSGNQVSVTGVMTALAKPFGSAATLPATEAAQLLSGMAEANSPQLLKWKRRFLNIVNRLTNDDKRTLSYHQAASWFSKHNTNFVTKNSFAVAADITPAQALEKLQTIPLIDPNATSHSKVASSAMVRWLDINNDGLIETNELRVRIYDSTAMSESQIVTHTEEMMSLARVSTLSLATTVERTSVTTLVMAATLAALTFVTIPNTGVWQSAKVNQMRLFAALIASWLVATRSVFLLQHLAQFEIASAGPHFRGLNHIIGIVLTFVISYVIAVGVEAELAHQLVLADGVPVSGTILLFLLTIEILRIMDNVKMPDRMRLLLRPILVNLWIIFIYANIYYQIREDFGSYDTCVTFGATVNDPTTNTSIPTCTHFVTSMKISTFLDAVLFSASVQMTVGLGGVAPSDSVRAKVVFVTQALLTLIAHSVTVSDAFYQVVDQTKADAAVGDEEVDENILVTPLLKNVVMVDAAVGDEQHMKSDAQTDANTPIVAQPKSTQNKDASTTGEVKILPPVSTAAQTNHPITLTDSARQEDLSHTERNQSEVEQFMMAD